jgi:hypothetical protein
MQRTMILLTACLGLSSCVKPGDFCEVYGVEPILFARETAAAILQTDRPAAERITVLNGYQAKTCKSSEKTNG